MIHWKVILGGNGSFMGIFGVHNHSVEREAWHKNKIFEVHNVSG